MLTNKLATRPSEMQEIKEYYKAKVANDPSWRPICCKLSMIKMSHGFYCTACKVERRFDMTRINRRAS